MKTIQPDDLAGLLAGLPILLMLDVDGTLCPIVEQPSAAIVSVQMRDLLHRLATHRDVQVALVTGRGVDDARRMVAVPGIRIHGNHGIEIADADGSVHIDARWPAVADGVASAASDLEPVLAGVPGAQLENKGYTLSVHYRDVPEPLRDDLVRAVSSVAERNMLRVTGGKMVLNVLPILPFDKGTSALALVQELQTQRNGAAVLFAGDDVTDEDAFVALNGSIPDAVTLKIGAGETEARYRLRSPNELYLALRHVEETLP